jgi:hypothetical protein
MKVTFHISCKSDVGLTVHVIRYMKLASFTWRPWRWDSQVVPKRWFLTSFTSRPWRWDSQVVPKRWFLTSFTSRPWRWDSQVVPKCWFLTSFTLRPWRWDRQVVPKRRRVKTQKILYDITTTAEAFSHNLPSVGSVRTVWRKAYAIRHKIRETATGKLVRTKRPA